MSNRKEALTWWRMLTKYQQETLATKYYPERPIIAIITSSQKVEEIYNKEN